MWRTLIRIVSFDENMHQALIVVPAIFGDAVVRVDALQIPSQVLRLFQDNIATRFHAYANFEAEEPNQLALQCWEY